MMNPLRVAAAALVLVSISEVSASELIAEQIDRIAPLVATGEVHQLGGPETAPEIVAGLAGRWFTLNNSSGIGSWKTARPGKAWRAASSGCAPTTGRTSSPIP
jgi:hypothetical protein